MGERLTVLREARSETQAVVAEAVGIERASLAAIELGEAVSLATLRALADYFAVTVDYLERGTPLPSGGSANDHVEQGIDPRLVAGWRALDQAQQELVLGIIAQMLGARVLPETARHVEPSIENAS